MNARYSCSGFTLLEVVIALAISAILAGIVATLIGGPVDAYIDQSERAQMTNASEIIDRSLSRDLQNVLPNSVRIRSAGNRSIVEMLEVEGISFFIPAGTYAVAGQPAQPAHELDLATANDTFRMFGRIDDLVDATPFLVSGHLGTSGASAYEMQNVIVSDFDVRVMGTGVDEIELQAGSTFTLSDTLRRMFWVRGPVSYICDNDAGTLSSFRNYSISSSAPASSSASQLAGATRAVLANNVRDCSFRCGVVGAGDVCVGTLSLEATVGRPSTLSNEGVKIFQQFVLDNRS